MPAPSRSVRSNSASSSSSNNNNKSVLSNLKNANGKKKMSIDSSSVIDSPRGSGDMMGSDSETPVRKTMQKEKKNNNNTKKIDEEEEQDEFDLANLPSTGKPASKRLSFAHNPNSNNRSVSKEASTKEEPTAKKIGEQRKIEDGSLRKVEASPKISELKKVFESTSNNVNVKKPTKIEELQARFEKLADLRETQAEQQYTHLKESMQARLDGTPDPYLLLIVAGEKLIAALKAENERLKSTTQSIPTTPNSTLPIGCNNNESLVTLFQELTGLRLSPIDTSKWLGEIEAFSFELELDEDEQQYIYRPRETLPHLPSYLKEEIVFDRAQAQPFFWRVLNFLMITNNSNGKQ